MNARLGRWLLGFVLLFGLAVDYPPTASAQVVVQVGPQHRRRYRHPPPRRYHHRRHYRRY